MKTILIGSTERVTITSDGPMSVIGECINPTRRRRLTGAFAERQYEFVLELAESQIQAGADVLDINVGVPGIN